MFSEGKLDDAEVEAWHEEGLHRYEWRIDMDGASGGQVRLRPNVVLSMEVAVWDKDEDGSASFITWGRKGGSPAQGDLVLVNRDTETGTVRGSMTWGEGDGEISRGKVRVQSLDVEGLQVEVETDQEGRYAVDVLSNFRHRGWAGEQ